MSPELYYEDVEVGDDIDPIERLVNQEQVAAFLAVRGNMPSGPSRFTDDAYARSEGLPGAIVPGALNMAMMSQLLTGWSPTLTVKKLEVVFRHLSKRLSHVELAGDLSRLRSSGVGGVKRLPIRYELATD